MAAWGERWLDLTSDHTDPAFALWAWVRVQLNRDELPRRRTVVEFDFIDQPACKRHWWLLIDSTWGDLCDHDPGGDHRAWVTARSAPFCDWHRGARSWTSVRRAGDTTVTGPRSIIRALPRWNTHVPELPPKSAVTEVS